MIASSGDPEGGYRQAWPNDEEREMLAEAYEGLVLAWKRVQMMAFLEELQMRMWHEAVTELIYRLVLITANSYDKMEKTLSVDVMDLFHVLVLCAIDVSKCTVPKHAIRGPMEKLRKFLAPADERQLHRYNEMALHEDRFLTLMRNDFSIQRGPWPYMTKMYRDRLYAIRGYLTQSRALQNCFRCSRKRQGRRMVHVP